MKYLLYPDITEDNKEMLVACVLVDSLENYASEKQKIREQLIKNNGILSDKLTEVILITREGKAAGNFYYVNKKMDDIILNFTTNIKIRKDIAKKINKEGKIIQ